MLGRVPIHDPLRRIRRAIVMRHDLDRKRRLLHQEAADGVADVGLVVVRERADADERRRHVSRVLQVRATIPP